MMDYTLQLILEHIKHELVCLVDGNELYFASGKEALAHFQKDNKHYSPMTLSAKDNTVVVEISDVTDDVKRNNAAWVAEHQARFGCEPNLFDGV